MAIQRDLGTIPASRQGKHPKRVKAAAYVVADGGQISTSPELELLSNIRVYGAEAVVGRPLGAGEIRRMNVAKNIVNAYNDKINADNQAQWAKDNKNKDAILMEALKLAMEMGYNPNA